MICMRINLVTYMILFLISPLISMAQDFTADMKKASATYYELEKFSMTVEASVFLNILAKTPDQQVVSYVKKYKDSYKTTTTFIETLYNPKYVIAVSKASKTIMYAPNDKKLPDLKEVFPMVDSMFARYDSVVYKGIVNGDKFYKIYMSNNAIKEVDIYLRPDFLFSKMVYICAEKQSIAKMETVFKNIEINGNLSAAEFETDHYINHTNPKRIAPTKAYGGYKVIYNDFALRNKQ